MDEKINRLLDSLGRSKFRSSFHLNNFLKTYVDEKGISTIESHAYDFINKRLKPKVIKNDGKQTPYRAVHPVFIAQHATGTCCRGCLEKIHHIPKGRELTNDEVDYIVKVIMTWIKREISK
jgi:exodeoxyribonuclease V alpha subunit